MTPAGALPPQPFTAQGDPIAAGTAFYRVHSSAHATTAFNPGFGSPTRFAFFGDPPVGVLYSAAAEDAAIAESLLHAMPPTGGVLTYPQYADAVMGRFTVARPLRLAKLRGLGLAALGVVATDVTDTGADQYPRTVRWAEAAHRAGFDGVSWTSRRCNDAQSIVLFADRCQGAVAPDAGYARMFRNPADLDWLIDMCRPLHVAVEPLPPVG